MNKYIAVIDAHHASLPALQQAIILAEGQPEITQKQPPSSPSTQPVTILALHPVYDLPAQIEKVLHGTLLQNLTHPIIENAELWLKQAISTYQSNVFHITQAVVWSSHTYEAIDEKCKDETFDLIVKKKDPRSSWINFLFHSDDWHILSHARTEVLMIDEPQLFNQATLLVALEASDPKHDDLNRRLLARAKQLQSDWAMEVVILHAYPNFTGLPSYGIDGGYYFDPEAMEELEAAHKQLTQHLVDESGLVAATILVEAGPPALLIKDKVAELQPACLMVGNLHNKGIPSIALHKPYDKLAADVSCALWVIPDNN